MSEGASLTHRERLRLERSARSWAKAIHAGTQLYIAGAISADLHALLQVELDTWMARLRVQERRWALAALALHGVRP